MTGRSKERSSKRIRTKIGCTGELQGLGWKSLKTTRTIEKITSTIADQPPPPPNFNLVVNQTIEEIFIFVRGKTYGYSQRGDGGVHHFKIGVG